VAEAQRADTVVQQDMEEPQAAEQSADGVAEDAGDMEEQGDEHLPSASMSGTAALIDADDEPLVPKCTASAKQEAGEPALGGVGQYADSGDLVEDVDARIPIRTPAGAAALAKIRAVQERRQQLYSRLEDKQDQHYEQLERKVEAEAGDEGAVTTPAIVDGRLVITTCSEHFDVYATAKLMLLYFSL
jgi:hypothetical protein